VCDVITRAAGQWHFLVNESISASLRGFTGWVAPQMGQLTEWDKRKKEREKEEKRKKERRKTKEKMKERKNKKRKKKRKKERRKN